MINVLKTTECVLCRACSTACPTGAIKYDKKSASFEYPTIDADKCIGCNKCARVCPVLNAPVPRQEKPTAYVARCADDANRLVATSGGIFRELAEAVLREGGLVSGVVLTETLSARHILTDDPALVDAMRGSKYQQSDTEGVYRDIETALKTGKSVLFSGLPCQSAALRTYLKRDYPGLTVVDLICHGVPSGETFAAYLRVMEKQYGAPVVSVQFRAKDMGWHCSAMKLTFANGRTYREPITVDAYFKGFLGNYTLKESCYDCRFRTYRSGSDLTLGDFWGAEAIPALAHLDDNRGLSAVLVHTDKGRELMAKLPATLIEVPLSTVEAGNPNLLVSPPVNPEREAYYAYAAVHGEEAAIIKYLIERPAERRKRKLRYRLRQCKHFLTGKKTLY